MATKACCQPITHLTKIVHVGDVLTFVCTASGPTTACAVAASAAITGRHRARPLPDG